MTKVYKNLVLEGNGMAGLAYIGVLKVLEERDMVKNFTSFSGSSSGAIMATLISIGYTSEEIYTISKDIDWSKLVQKRNCLYRIFHFWNNYGLFKYDKIEKIIKSFFLRKLGKTDLTFQEHYDLTKKNLIMVGVNVNKKRPEYFCKDLTPNMSVLTAIKISTSFPFIFDPVKYNNMLYVDGGLMNNFPIEYFNGALTDTLGINLVDDDFNPSDPYNTITDIENILNYGVNILQSIMLIQEYCDLEFIKDNIIYVKIPSRNTYDTIVLMNQNIEELYNHGMKCSKKFFNNNDLVTDQPDGDL